MKPDLNPILGNETDWPLNQGHLDSGLPEFTSSGYVFRDGTCILCHRPPPIDWQKAVEMVETVAAGSDYLRVDIFAKDGLPVLNEVTITSAAVMWGVPLISHELARRWLEGYLWLGSS